MATKFLLNLFALWVLLVLIRAATSDPILSCSQTPYPQVCTSSLMTTTSTNSPFSQAKTASSFRNLALTATMEQVALTHQLASTMDLSSLDEQAKAAWADCLVLYEDTISQLNRSMSPSSSHEDSQTWLSAAIANHETCKNGFIELNSSVHLPTSPFMTNNISESISNSLAINKAMATVNSLGGGNRKLLSDGNGFPSWVSAADRKLLQSSSVKANLVVAQDGSGNYKTVSEAVAASVKQRSGGSRFVIYVKGGTYNEKVVITKSMKNLMLIGDGIDKTVITGSKSFGGGSTTFNSATVGKLVFIAYYMKYVF